MIVIGVVGGIASGKSLVAQQLAQLGAEVLNADRVGHQVLEEPEVRLALCERFGGSIVDKHGLIDRAAVARIVFAPPPDGPRELEFLEQVTHPRIKERLGQQLQEMAQRGAEVAVLDAALLLRAGWHTFCDRIVFVDAPGPLRQQRAAERGWDLGQMARREAAQEPLEEKRRRADWVIDNSGPMEHTFSQVHAFWQSLADFAHCTSPNERGKR